MDYSIFESVSILTGILLTFLSVCFSPWLIILLQNGRESFNRKYYRSAVISIAIPAFYGVAIIGKKVIEGGIGFNHFLELINAALIYGMIFNILMVSFRHFYLQWRAVKHLNEIRRPKKLLFD